MAAWIAVLAGPIVMIVGLAVLRPTTPPASPVPGTQAAPQEPQGWAEMYVRAWLSASRDDSAGVEGFFPAGMKSTRGVSTQVPVDTATLGVTSPSPGLWSVTIAVNLLTQQPDGKHVARLTCVQVSLASGDQGSSYVAASLPSPVACPSRSVPVDLDYRETADPNGPIGQSVLGFLTSYLVGRGELARYVTPGTSLVPVTPAPYAAVQLVELRTHETFEAGQAARPLDGAEIHVSTRAWGSDATGQITAMDYALTLVARAGRWEISRIDTAPLLAGPPTTASTTTSTSSATTQVSPPGLTTSAGE